MSALEAMDGTGEKPDLQNLPEWKRLNPGFTDVPFKLCFFVGAVFTICLCVLIGTDRSSGMVADMAVSG